MSRVPLSEALAAYDLKGVHPAAEVFPLMDDDEYEELVASAVKDGWTVPVLATKDGILYDGRNRLIASMDSRLRLDVRVQQKDSSDIWGMVKRLNLHRHNNTPTQKAAIAIKMDAGKAAEQAKERKKRKPVNANLSPSAEGDRTGMASEAIAGDAGVSRATVERVLTAKDDPELMAAMIAGEVSAREAERTVKDRKEEERAAARKAKRAEAVRIELPALTHKRKDTAVSVPERKSKAVFNTTNDSVDWARFTWNPITGCLHGCTYCYAREIAVSTRMAEQYPNGFDPVFRSDRLGAPANTKVPKQAKKDPAYGRVFVGSMTDVFGKWVPKHWQDAVFDACDENAQWKYLFLTKFPVGYTTIDLPKHMWAGASVDRQAVVRRTIKSMRDLDVSVRWLSLEPMLEPLTFNDLEWCDLVVIGSQTQTRQPTGVVPAFAPQMEWVTDLVAQARNAGAAVYLKANLLGNTNGDNPGMVLPHETPKERY